MIVHIQVEVMFGPRVIVQEGAGAGAGAGAGFEARTAKLLSLWVFSLSICSFAALLTRGFLPVAFAPSLVVAATAALEPPLVVPPLLLPPPRPRFAGPSAL